MIDQPSVGAEYRRPGAALHVEVVRADRIVVVEVGDCGTLWRGIMAPHAWAPWIRDWLAGYALGEAPASTGYERRTS